MVRPLADVDRAAEQGDATIAVQLELHLRVRHVVPVDGGAGTAQVGADGKAEAATAWHGAAALEESGTFDNLINACPQAAACDAQPVDRARVGTRQVAQPQLDRIETELFRDLVEVRLQGEARLRGAVASLGPTGRLVGEHPDSFESIARDRVGGRLEGAGVVGTGHAVAPIAAAIEEAAKLHRRDAAVFRQPRLDLHQHGVTPAVRVEDLLARERDLHGSPGDHGEPGGHQLVGEDVALAAEAAAVRRRDHADAAHRQLEHLAKGAVDVMRGLR